MAASHKCRPLITRGTASRIAPALRIPIEEALDGKKLSLVLDTVGGTPVGEQYPDLFLLDARTFLDG